MSVRDLDEPHPISADAIAIFTPLGVPVVVEAARGKDMSLIAHILRSWTGDAKSSERPLRVRIVRDRWQRDTRELQFHVNGSVLRIEGGGVDCHADATSGEASCCLSSQRFSGRARLLEEAFKTILLFLLGARGRIPVHASAFLLGDVAILFAGTSGSGKSCLALAAAEAGYRIVAEDIVYVQTEPRLRIWGLPGPIHVYPGDAPKGSSGPFRLRGGKLKRALADYDQRTAVSSRRAVLCVLAPGTGLSLRPIAQGEALSLLNRPEPGFDRIWTDVQSAHAALSREGAWLLGLSTDPSEAIELLARNAERLQARAPS